MRSIKAIFIKQAKDMMKNPAVLLQFIIFPAVALVMTELVAKSNEGIPPNMFTTMMAAIFAGMALVTTTASIIAEDMERKSLRFLVMAGVKPHEYLAGVGGFILLAGAVVSVVFGFIGSFTATEFAKFLTVLMMGVAASIMLGATIGMLSKNQQAATALSMPVAMMLGFAPMIASFNGTVEKFARVLYTQQLNVIVNDFSANFAGAMLVIGANMMVLLVFFVIAYQKKGLKLKVGMMAGEKFVTVRESSGSIISQNSDALFRNIRITLRSLRRSGVYSVINVVGLAMSLATCAFIVLWVQDERSYDRFHKDAENIYLAVTHMKISGNEMLVPLTPGPVGPAAKEDFPSVEDFCRVRNWSVGFLRHEDVKTSSVFCIYADSTFFDFFNFPIIRGNRVNPLRNPADVVVSERLAGELFGKEDPIGKTVSLDDGRTVHVTAVMKNFPKNTYLWENTDLVSSFAIDGTSLSSQVMNIWEATDFFSFIRVKQGTDMAYMAQHLNGKQSEMWQTFRWFLLQPMANLHLYTLDGQPAGIKTVRLFQWIALIIFVIACINYVNLVTARASKRQREIGLKKVLGAKKWQLFLQLISEAAVLFVIAIFVALILNLMLLPLYYPLSGKEITFGLFDVNIWMVYIGMLVAVISLAGMYPAWLLASFRATNVVQTDKIKRGSALFRKTLVVTQFVASASLIAGAIVMTAQMKYMRGMDLGYAREQVLICPMQNMSRHYHAVRTELERQTSILAVTAASDNIMDVNEGYGFGNWEGKTDVNAGLMQLGMRVDTSFLRVMGLQLVDGSNFTSAYERQYIMNEAAIKTMGMKEPVGKWVERNDTKIAGVVRDFHFRSLHHEIGPFVMYYDPEALSNLYVRTLPGNIRQAISAVENLWNRYNPDYAFTYSFMDDTFNRMYVSEIRANRLFGIFSFIAVIISCLGLFGLVVFTAELKTKEIGIRKVLGASIFDIVKLLSREFLILVGISLLIALPLAYWWLDSLLQDFAYRISIVWWMFAAAGVITIALTLLTVGWMAVKAAVKNPVEAIKSD